MTPYMAPASVPNKITGPQTVKILAPTPRTYPSERESIAGDATALAKPVMGSRVPAPARLAILSYTPMPVRITDKKIRVIELNACACEDGMNGMYL